MAQYPSSSGQRSPGGGFGGLKLAPLLFALVSAAVFAVKGCQSGPYGRVQIRALNNQQEADMGAQAFQQVLSENKNDVVSDNAPLSKIVARIGERMAKASTNEDFLKAVKLPPQTMQWSFKVIDSEQVNAFCLPGGKVVVYTGIAPVADTEVGLATVMGHEIAHALAHHGAERMAQTQLAQIVQQGANASLGDMTPGDRDKVMGLLSAGSRVGILGFSRKHESEADRVGLMLMAAAGYDPSEASHFWERMREKTGDAKAKKPPEFLSTHPSHERRSEDLKSWLPTALPLYEASQKATTARDLLPSVRQAVSPFQGIVPGATPTKKKR